VTSWLKRRAFGGLIKLELGRLERVAKASRSRKAALPFPRDLAELAHAGGWCVDQLRAAGALAAGATVESVSVTPFATGLAFRSLLARVSVAWRSGEAAGTLAVVAKLAPEARDLRDHAIYLLQQNHLKEAGFYERYAATAEVAPRSYYAAADADSGHYCVLMEDLSALASFTEAAGCPAEHLPLVARRLARFHARHWRQWDQGAALPGFLAPPPDVAIAWFSEQVEGAGRQIRAAICAHAWRHDLSGPRTLLHGDARVGNMLLPTAEQPDRFALYDWQATRVGRGPFDLAYFLTLSVDPAVRRDGWDALWDAYHAELVASGVSGYSRAALDDDAFNAAVLAIAFVTLPFLSKESSATAANAPGLAELTATWRARALAMAADLDPDRLARWCGLPPKDVREAMAAAIAEETGGRP
jgi:hypothetical protein